MENLLNRITINPEIAHGKPTIRDTRYAVVYILEYLAGGDSVEDLLQEFKGLERDDILACLAYAAKMLDFRESKVPAA
ncbi:DUF433 domain-containing protein [Lunatibacter salilacus]|uniref:DUF433 domain-containing protein n=1 Tax=Lunatibacter salilacus TaxID=2483804 RepID=UPI00131CDF81|nr:DUF433 domain-containing protein [Lunatibacter salilacus]